MPSLEEIRDACAKVHEILEECAEELTEAGISAEIEGWSESAINEARDQANALLLLADIGRPEDKDTANAA